MLANYGIYFISQSGKVYNTTSGKELHLSVDSKGYKVLRQRGEKDHRVHRLVATIYIPNENNLPEVNHINGNKQDNRVENLEWVTHKENCLHAYKAGLHKPSEKQRQAAAEYCRENKSKKIKNLETGIEYKSVRDASRQTKIPPSSICYDINHSKNPKWIYL